MENYEQKMELKPNMIIHLKDDGIDRNIIISRGYIAHAANPLLMSSIGKITDDKKEYKERSSKL